MVTFRELGETKGCAICGADISDRHISALKCFSSKCTKTPLNKIRLNHLEDAKLLISYHLFAETPLNRKPTVREAEVIYWVVLDFFANRDIDFNAKEIGELEKFYKEQTKDK